MISNHKFVKLIILTALLLVAFGSTVQAQTPIVSGYRDFEFRDSGVSAPSGQKPQSKLWYNDGLWWGALYERASNTHTIFRFNTVTQAWTDTGVLVDIRRGARIDALWDGTHLYTVAAGIDTGLADDSAEVRRYSYNTSTDTYSLDVGFPVTVSNNGMELSVMEKDSTGTLWVTYTQGSQVYVTHSNGNDTTWVSPYVLPVGTAANVNSDDVSTIVSFGGNKIGVFWSNQNDDAFYFAVHNDGASDATWTLETALSGNLIADDHINIKVSADGVIYAAVKTSLNDWGSTPPTAFLLRLLVRQTNGSWSWHGYSQVQYDQTRPIVVLDDETRTIHMFATSPVGSATSGWIYHKSTSMDSIAFPPGIGTSFMESTTDDHINNVTSTKQALDCDSGVLVVAGDDTSKFYFHNYIECPSQPDLYVVKTNNVGGSVTGNTSWQWTLSVSNTASALASFGSNQRILLDNLPTNLSYSAVSVQNQTGITGNISCQISSNVLTCTAQGGLVNIAATTGSFDVVFTATPSQAGTYVNPTSGVCSVDPDNNIVETNEANNSCSNTVISTAAGFSIVESAGTTITSEAPSQDTFTVVLDAQPASDVVLTVVSADTGEGTVAPASLTFTSLNWNTPQVVTVTGVDDLIVDGDISYDITVAVDDANSDNAFDALADQVISATNQDDDGAGFSIVESGGTTITSEAPSQDTFTVVLDAQPASDVVLTVVSADTGEGTVAPASLTFTSLNWNTPQEVTVTGVDDLIVDGDISYDITVAVDDANSDDAFDPLADQVVSATNQDNDGAGFSIVESAGTTITSEAPSQDTFTVVLDAQPASDVVLTVVSADTGEGTVAPASLTFTTLNWNTPQEVTVTGVDDLIVDGDISYDITVAVDDANSDDAFDALADEVVSATNQDNDVPLPSQPVISAPSGTTSDTTPNVVWGDTGDATQYRVWVRTTEPFITATYDATVDAVTVCSVGTCQLTLPTLSDAHYLVYVRGINATGWGSWSASSSFTVNSYVSAPSQAVISAPSGATNDTTPNVVWADTNNASQYRVWVRTVSPFSVVYDVTVSAATVCSAGTCQVTLPTLAETEYFAYVRGYNTLGWGSWSNYKQFAVTSYVSTPSQAVVSAPSGTVTDTTPDVVWADTTDASQYRVWVRVVSPFSVAYDATVDATSVCNAGTCQLTLPTLAETSYVAYVRSYNPFGWGTWSMGRGFTVSAPLALANASEAITPEIQIVSSYLVRNEGSSIFNTIWLSNMGEDAIVTTDVGNVTPQPGGWLWETDASDNTALTTVTVSATDGLGTTIVDTFDYEILNVNPTATFRNIFDDPVFQGTSARFIFTDSTDASLVDVTAGFNYAMICDSQSSDTQIGVETSYTCTYDAPNIYTVMGMIRDKDGGISSYSLIVEVITPAQATQYIKSVIQNLNTNDGLSLDASNQLSQMMDNVQASLVSGNTQNGLNQVTAFINQVNSYVALGTLSQAQGDLLIGHGQRLISSIISVTP